MSFLWKNLLYAGKTFNRFYIYLIKLIDWFQADVRFALKLFSINYDIYKKVLGVCNFIIITVNQQVILIKRLMHMHLIKGNRSTSETTCKLSLNTFNFSNYKNEYDKNIDTKFLEWFIGFTEGDGSLNISVRSKNNSKELKFDITQSLSDVQVLYYIKSKLGFGKVFLRPERNVGFYYVTGKDNFRKLITIFNGNFCGEHKSNQLKNWIKCYNEIYKDNIKFIDNLNQPNVNNGWISGFTDAEGSFMGRLRTTKKSQVNTYPNLIFQIAQKDKIILEKIRFAFFGKKDLWIRYDKSWDGYRLSLESIKNLNDIASYFNKYSLKTKKHITFLVWRNILKLIVEKKHLEPQYLNTLNKMVSKLNK